MSAKVIKKLQKHLYCWLACCSCCCDVLLSYFWGPSSFKKNRVTPRTDIFFYKPQFVSRFCCDCPVSFEYRGAWCVCSFICITRMSCALSIGFNRFLVKSFRSNEIVKRTLYIIYIIYVETEMTSPKVHQGECK